MFRRFAILVNLIFVNCLIKQASARNYSDYHKMINRAEELMFVHNKFDSGLFYYQKAFLEFDFVYAGDCLIAIQMALYANNEKAFLRFTQKAFENGLMLRNFKKVHYIKNHRFYLKDTLKFQSIYNQARPHYLKRIDTTTLVKILRLFANDQLVKNSVKYSENKFESDKEHFMRYKPLIRRTTDSLVKIIIQKGIPNDRIIGISQRDIMKELSLNEPDLEEYYWKNKDQNLCVIEKGQFLVDEWLLFPNYIFPIIVHADKYFYEKFGLEFYIEQIKQGNIHPKDVSFFNDAFNEYNAMNESDLKFKAGTDYFAIGYRPNKLAPNSHFVSDSVINIGRRRLFIPPIEQDKAKWQFMQKNKMNFGWGYQGIRS